MFTTSSDYSVDLQSSLSTFCLDLQNKMNGTKVSFGGTLLFAEQKLLLFVEQKLLVFDTFVRGTNVSSPLCFLPTLALHYVFYQR